MRLPAALRDALIAARDAERDQIAFYRALAIEAERAGQEGVAERVNGLLADEQHHYSRLVARLMETEGLMGGGVPATLLRDIGWTGWEERARARERGEIERYVSLLTFEMDAATRTMLEAFLDAERRHERELGGKWMGA